MRSEIIEEPQGNQRTLSILRPSGAMSFDPPETSDGRPVYQVEVSPEWPILGGCKFESLATVSPIFLFLTCDGDYAVIEESVFYEKL